VTLQSDAPAHPRLDVRTLVARLTLDEKISLLTGSTAWRLHALPSIGLRSLAMSDGPVGVRGLGEVEDETSALFPSPSAISATWDPALAFEIGRAFGQEARAHGVDVVLAPQVNIQRTPLGGRHFECYSEDPWLTALIGTSVVSGIQDQGVAACVKHFIANDSETDRTRYVARVGEQALREVYLAPFEHAVKTGAAWTVMAAYNGVDDGIEASPMTDHHRLVTGLLKGELGFDGVVVSDWMATRSTAGSANGGLDVVMPGPGGPWDDQLRDAVLAGEVDESVIDDKVARILTLARRVGALDTPERPLAASLDLADLIATTAARATVVLKRDAPVWDGPVPSRIALIGPNAVRPHVLGGGSSTVHPAHVVSPEEGLRSRFPAAEVVVRRGGDSRRNAPDLEGATVVTALYLDSADLVIDTRILDSWDGWLRDLPDTAHSVTLLAEVVLAEPGEHYLEVATVGGHRIVIDGMLVHEDDAAAGVEVILDSSINTPDGWGATITIAEPRRVLIESTHLVIRAGGYGAIIRAALRHRPPGTSADAEIAAAVAAARDSDLAVVIVGTNEEVESEGWDRVDLSLPGRQNELVEAVLDVAPDAVIVVNAGAPVILPWLRRARTVLWAWFPGQEVGHSLAAILAGDLEPAGRLPWTLPSTEADSPAPGIRPDAAGILDYAESIHVGYREWERRGTTPAAPFGHGLGWSDWSYDSVDGLDWTPDGDLRVALTITNTGTRASRETVQVYLEPPEGALIERPVRWLAGFAGALVAAGASQRVVVDVPRRSFEAWDSHSHHWTRVTGSYAVRIGRSIRDLHLDAVVRVETDGRSAPSLHTPHESGDTA